VLSEGHDRLSNLEKSIMVSLTSPRLTSTLEAKALLGLSGPPVPTSMEYQIEICREATFRSQTLENVIHYFSAPPWHTGIPINGSGY
jgi:hypothetical protein